MITRLKLVFHSIMAPHGKQAFVQKIPKGGKVLDLGCGNNSPMLVKTTRPDVEYWGLDVGDYNNETGKKYADHYILTEPDKFAKIIADLPQVFDAIISSHNIEHCNLPNETMEAFIKKLKKGGLLYFAFPCEDSVSFPTREGTLNFYDDKTHIYLPKYREILDTLRENGIRIVFSSRKYRPFVLALIGCVLEPLSKVKNRVLMGTWAFWGFETKIWGEKK